MEIAQSKILSDKVSDQVADVVALKGESTRAVVDPALMRRVCSEDLDQCLGMAALGYPKER